MFGTPGPWLAGNVTFTQKDGLLAGNPGQLGIQAIAVGASIVYSAVMTFVILKLIDVFVGLRVPESEEVLGLDASQHREAAYQI